MIKNYFLILLLGILSFPAFCYSDDNIGLATAPASQDDSEIELISKNSIKKKIQRKIAMQSTLIKNMLEEKDEDDDTMPSIPLPQVEMRYLKIILELMQKIDELKDEDDVTKKAKLLQFIEKKQNDWRLTVLDFVDLCKGADYLVVHNVLKVLALWFVTYNQEVGIGILNELGPTVSEYLAKEYFLLYGKPMLISANDVISSPEENNTKDVDTEKLKKIGTDWQEKVSQLNAIDAKKEIIYPVCMHSQLHTIVCKNFTLSDFIILNPNDILNIIAQIHLINPIIFEFTFKDPAIEQSKKSMVDGLASFVKENSHKKGFNAWFDKAKKIKGFVEKIASAIWDIAQSSCELGENYITALFDNIEEEGLLKMALRIRFYEATGQLIDDLDISRIFKKYCDNNYSICLEGQWEQCHISFVELSRYFNLTGNYSSYDKFVNTILYLLLGKEKQRLNKQKIISMTFQSDRLSDAPDALFYSQTYAKNTSTLNLDGNKIKVLSSQLSRMKKLSALSLVCNNLSCFPEPIKKMKGLKTLDVRGNKDIALPEWIVTLKNLKHLSINENKKSSNLIKKLRNKGVRVVEYK